MKLKCHVMGMCNTISMMIGHVILPVAFALALPSAQLYAQDPSFSQFWASPLNMNPALTANINGDWRLISNFRNQWIGPTAPYVTSTISFDSKVFKDKLPDGQRFGAGAMFMYDKTMGGVLKSNYASGNVSYSIKIAEGYGSHFVGAGIGLTYGTKQMDWSKVSFGEQYNGRGFDQNLPTGEAALSAMKPYLSASMGLTYTYHTELSNFDLGVAGFHLNKPRQTFLEDDNQRLPIRYVVHANYESTLSDELVVTTNAAYQKQGTASYFSVGGGLGYILDAPTKTSLSGGLWYWSKNSVIPYVGFSYKQIQMGFSYDVLISKLKDSPGKRSTWEFSLIFRPFTDDSGIIYCPPWK